MCSVVLFPLQIFALFCFCILGCPQIYNVAQDDPEVLLLLFPAPNGITVSEAYGAADGTQGFALARRALYH